MIFREPRDTKPANTLSYRDGRPADWRDSAACAEVDPDLFHPQKGSRADAAKAICRTCPSLTACLEHALDTHPEGIWGGTSERERVKIRAARRKEGAA